MIAGGSRCHEIMRPFCSLEIVLFLISIGHRITHGTTTRFFFLNEDLRVRGLVEREILSMASLGKEGLDRVTNTLCLFPLGWYARGIIIHHRDNIHRSTTRSVNYTAVSAINNRVSIPRISSQNSPKLIAFQMTA